MGRARRGGSRSGWSGLKGTTRGNSAARAAAARSGHPREQTRPGVPHEHNAAARRRDARSGAPSTPAGAPSRAAEPDG
eukprot:3793288-Alexandrium_andersonii.AAC.1